MEVVGFVASALQLLDANSRALEGLEGLEYRKNPKNIPELVRLSFHYHTAVTRLRDLLDSDIQHELPNADLVRLDGLCRSSLVLGSIIFAEIE